MEAKAIARQVRISPTKSRQVLTLIRGKNAGQALETLRFTPKKAARVVEKVLKSAIANAENNANLSADSLVVKSARIENGPVLKRFKAGAKGSAKPRTKKMAHIRIVLSDGNDNN